MLNPGDLITAVELGAARAARSVYRKVRERASFAFAVVSVAAAVDLRRRRGGGVPDRARRRRPRAVAGGARRKRCCEAARRAGGSFAAAADAELAAAEPLRDNAFKVPLARNVLVRTLAELTA